MKPIKYTRIIELWDCGITDHNHYTFAGAEKCILSQQKKTLSQQRMAQKKADRLARDHAAVDMFRRAINGETFDAIGQAYDLSGSRCREIIARVIRMSLHPTRTPRPLPDFARNRGIREIRKHPDFWLARADAMDEYYKDRAG